MSATNRPLPVWFDLDRYACTHALDAGEWLMNLLFRCWVARTNDPFGLRVVQGVRPVLRRGDPEQIQTLAEVFFMREHKAPGGLLALLEGRPVRGGVQPLTILELYHFEGKLPADVRERGARYTQGDRTSAGCPDVFLGRLDHAFEPQMLGRFVRVDLSLPDGVLLHDLATFIRSEREDLAKKGGKQPYREAVRIADKKRPRLSTLATIGLLPFLDLQQWADSCQPPVTDYQLAGLIGTDPNRMGHVREYAERCHQEVVIRAWLEPAARGVPAKSKRPR